MSDHFVIRAVVTLQSLRPRIIRNLWAAAAMSIGFALLVFVTDAGSMLLWTAVVLGAGSLVVEAVLMNVAKVRNVELPTPPNYWRSRWRARHE